MFDLIVINLAFLTSILSATALIGLFVEFKFWILITDLSFIIFPFQRLGLNGLIGEIESFWEFKLNMGPWTDKLYAVLPAGVDTKTPSDLRFFIIILLPFVILSETACLLCLRIETSFIAI